jgi:cytochrome c peroxidase
MHDGSMATLEDVVDHYANGGTKNQYLDEEIFLIKLEEKDRADLITFLKEGLSSDSYPDHRPPILPE